MANEDNKESLKDQLSLARKKIAELETSQSAIKTRLEREREAQKVYRALVDEAFFGARVGIILLDSDFRVAWVNSSIERYFGIPADEMLGKDKRQLVSRKIKNIFENPEAFEQRIIASYEDNSYVENFRCHVLAAPGREERWLEHWSEPIRKGLFSNGRIETYIDVTESVKAQRRLQYLTKLLHAIRKVNQLIVSEKNPEVLLKGVCRFLVETGAYYSVWIALLDKAGKATKMAEHGIGDQFKKMARVLKEGGPKQCRLGDYRRGDDVLVLLDPYNQCSGCPLAKFYRGRSAIRTRLRYNKEIYGIMVASLPKEFAQDTECKELFAEVAGDVAFALHALDLEQLRRKVEAALRESEARYRMLYEHAGEPIFTYDKNLTLIDVNTAACQKVGLSKKELVGKNILELGLLHPADVEKALEHLRSLLEGKEIARERLRFKGKDGSYLTADVIATTIRQRGKVVAITNVCHDLTEKERLYDALRKSEEKFRLLSENAPDLIFSLGPDGAITYVNRVVKEILGYEAAGLIGTYPTELTGEEHKKLFIQLFKRVRETNEPLRNIRVSLVDNKGIEHMFLLSCSVVVEGKSEDLAVVGMLKDITEQHKLEALLRQAQKMEAIGTLAGGIAHDFNNILSSVIGYSELAVMDLPSDSEAAECIQQVLRAASRARDLVKQILSFSRQGEQKRRPVSVGPIVKEALKLLKASLPSTIQIVQEMQEDPGIIEADPTEIHQVLMNLCTNAEYAMREAGGTLRVRLDRRKVVHKEVLHGGELQPGEYVRLTVSDTGHGMEQHIVERIFDPYFTTKESGEGTGLGLAVVHGIVNSYGGAVGVTSEVGKGSSFEVYFPASEKGEVTSQQGEEMLPLGHEAVLFIDDEEELARAGKLMLEKLGYNVTTRTSSVEALELFKVNPDRFDLVITDLTMPNITGDKLASMIHEIRPDVPIILCTGFSTRVTEKAARDMGIARLMMKPLSIKDLASAVRSVLDGTD